eukprot:2995516-Rhodomonas_salina.3
MLTPSRDQYSKPKEFGTVTMLTHLSSTAECLEDDRFEGQVPAFVCGGHHERDHNRGRDGEQHAQGSAKAHTEAPLLFFATSMIMSCTSLLSVRVAP